MTTPLTTADEANRIASGKAEDYRTTFPRCQKPEPHTGWASFALTFAKCPCCGLDTY